MKHVIRTAVLAAFTTFGFAIAANATCLTGCSGGDAPPPPDPATLTISGNVGTAGYGLAVPGGTEGSSYAVKDGGSTLVLGLSGGGGLCGSDPCDSFDAYGVAAMWEQIYVGASGYSEHANTPATAYEETAGAGAMVLSWPTGDFGLGINTGTAGQAVGMFAGDSGEAYGITEGYNTFSAGMHIDGLCPTCSSGGYHVTAEVGETAVAGAAGYSWTPGTPAVAENTTATAGMIKLTLGVPNEQ